jgi:hypothetical protein
LKHTRYRSILRTIQRASRGVKALIAVVTLLSSLVGAYQSFYPLVREASRIGSPVSCPHAIEPFRLAISSEKYQYNVGENVSIYYYVNSNATLKISAEKPDDTQVPLGTFLPKVAGTYRAVLGSAWYPTGVRRLVAEASSGSNVAQAASFYLVVDKHAQELAPLRAGARVGEEAFYNSSFQLLALDAEDSLPGQSREVTRFPGQSIGVSISYRLWNTSNMTADQAWQIVLVYSWAQTWPPTSEYQVLYSGSPGRFPVPVSSARFNITAPSLPGTYYAWIVLCPSKTTAEAISNLEAPLGLPAHLKIVVKPRQKSTLSLSASSSEILWGSSVTLAGGIEPQVDGGNVTICFSQSQGGDSRLVGYVITNAIGEFARAWAPSSLGNYVIMATWFGSEEIDPATSTPVPLTITFPWANLTIIAALFCVGAVTSFYLLRTATRTRSGTGDRRRTARRSGEKKTQEQGLGRGRARHL